MVSEYEEMPYDADVVARVLDKRDDITPKHVAMHCHLHVATVYKYLGGERTIPSSFLRAVFELTGDFQILGLITGTVPVTFQAIQADHKPGCPNAQPVRIPPIAEWLPRTCKSLKSVAEATTYVGEIIKDDKFNRDDLAAAENLKRHACDAMRDLSIMVAAVEAEMRKVRA